MTASDQRIAHVAIVVPAADEEKSVAACLESLDAAVRFARLTRPNVSTRMVVVLDRCLDGTADVVRDWPGLDVVVSTAGNVGAARDQGSRWAVGRSPAPAARTWTAHTDADSVVPAHWLHHHLDHAELGAALVLGTVVPEVDEPLLTEWKARHRAGDGHRHVHGANLGIRADALHAVGGWRHHPLHEDADLVARAEAAGLDIVRTGGVAVRTSGRFVGRTDGGLAGYLRDLATGTDA